MLHVVCFVLNNLASSIPFLILNRAVEDSAWALVPNPRCFHELRPFQLFLGPPTFCSRWRLFFWNLWFWRGSSWGLYFFPNLWFWRGSIFFEHVILRGAPVKKDTLYIPHIWQCIGFNEVSRMSSCTYSLGFVMFAEQSSGNTCNTNIKSNTGCFFLAPLYFTKFQALYNLNWPPLKFSKNKNL